MAYKGSRINPKRFDKSQLKILIGILPLLAFTGLPIIFIICHAFKPMEELFAYPPKFFVTRPTLDNFANLFKASRTSGIPMSRYGFNTLIITVSVVGFSLFFSTLSAYALSKLRFKGKNALFKLNQAAMMFVPTAVMIPTYLTVDFLQITDTYLAHIMPLVALPVSLFLLKQFIDTVPDALIDAAYMDGATDFRVYAKIIIPLIKPAIATAAILVFQQAWSDVTASNYYITDESMKNLQFYMSSLSTANNSVAGQALIMFVPNLIFFIVVYNSVMNTMSHSGIK